MTKYVRIDQWGQAHGVDTDTADWVTTIPDTAALQSEIEHLKTVPPGNVYRDLHALHAKVGRQREENIANRAKISYLKRVVKTLQRNNLRLHEQRDRELQRALDAEGERNRALDVMAAAARALEQGDHDGAAGVLAAFWIREGPPSEEAIRQGRELAERLGLLTEEAS